jgi:hypothetical protein
MCLLFRFPHSTYMKNTKCMAGIVIGAEVASVVFAVVLIVMELALLFGFSTCMEPRKCTAGIVVGAVVGGDVS